MRLPLLPALVSALAVGLALPGPAAASGRQAGERYKPGEVIVRYESAGALPRTEVRKVSDVPAAIRRLEGRPGVLSATPNFVAHVSGWMPPDPGRGTQLSGWQQLQWNFLERTGVNAPDAWDHLITVGRPGGAGVTVAVVDTGIAYSNRGRFVRSPDFSPYRFVRGYDFVGDDPYPNDDNGHGTHVASTIGEGTGNGVGLTGLAYGVKLMPIKVLDADGEGDSAQIARGIRWAADHGAKIINLSFEFPAEVTRFEIPNILDAIRYAKSRNVLVVGASGNEAKAAVAYPARSSAVLSVGATTEHGCQADYSNEGSSLDLVAPGGGEDSDIAGDVNCKPDEPAGLDIFQMTFRREKRIREFGLPDGFIGTSMAAPHVTATAALVVASGLLGPDPTPDAIERRLKLTARDLGPPGKDPHYGAGLLSAAAATDPRVPVT